MSALKYTDEILDHNFHLLGDFMGNCSDDLSLLSGLLEKHEMRMNGIEHGLDALSKSAKIIVKVPKRSKLVVVGVVAGAAYFGYKVALSRMNAEINHLTVADKKPANVKTEKD